MSLSNGSLRSSVARAATVAASIGLVAFALIAPAHGSGTGPLTSAPEREIIGTGAWEPFGVAADDDGRLYVANFYAGEIQVFAPDASGSSTPIARLSGPSGSPTAVWVAQDQSVWATYWGSCTVARFDPVTGAAPNPISPSGQFVAGSDAASTATRLDQCIGIAADSDASKVYVATRYGWLAQYAFSDVATPPSLPTRSPARAPIEGLGNSLGLSFDPQGRIVVGDNDNLVAFAATASGNRPTPAWTLQVGPGVSGAAFDPSGRIYVGRDMMVADSSRPNPIAVYPAGASGSTAPIASIAAGRTGSCSAWADVLSQTNQCNTPYLAVTPDGGTLYVGSTLRSDTSRVLAIATADLVGAPSPPASPTPTPTPSATPDPAPPIIPTPVPTSLGSPAVATPSPTATQTPVQPSANPASLPAQSANRVVVLPGGLTARGQGTGKACIGSTCITGSRWSISLCVPTRADIRATGARVSYASGGCGAGLRRAVVQPDRNVASGRSSILVRHEGTVLARATIRTQT